MERYQLLLSPFSPCFASFSWPLDVEATSAFEPDRVGGNTMPKIFELKKNENSRPCLSIHVSCAVFYLHLLHKKSALLQESSYEIFLP